jgi:hypothetical protein
MPAAGATRDFQWRSNHDSTSQRQKIEIGQTGHLHPARYIDFLVPGLLGMGLMGGGFGVLDSSLWTCAFASCSNAFSRRP